MVVPMPSKPTAKLLTYAGTLPLLGAAFGQTLGILSPEHAFFVASTYSVVIASFLAGIHWACALFYPGRCPRNLFITSNVVALLAWLSVLLNHPVWSLILPILCFLYLLVLDLKLREAGLLPGWFYRLRLNATGVVVISLSILIATA